MSTGNSRAYATSTRGCSRGTLQYRPVVLTLWAIVAVLMIPFYMFSQRELAPAEDQGVVFGVIQSSANSTLDQTNLFTEQVYNVYKSFPESESVFQITNPERRFWWHGHETLEPADQDDTAIAASNPRARCRRLPGIRVIPLTPPPLPGGGNFPVDFVIASSAEPQQVSQSPSSLCRRRWPAVCSSLRTRT